MEGDGASLGVESCLVTPVAFCQEVSTWHDRVWRLGLIGFRVDCDVCVLARVE